MFRYCLIIWLLVFPWVASSAEVDDLYMARVAVPTQQNNHRTAALQKALAEVLIKIGGDIKATQNSLLASALTNVNRYLTQYRYEMSEQQQYLIATFNEDKINQLFIDANVPIWGKLRPQIMFWIVYEEDLNRSLLSASSEHLIKDAISEQARRFGLPILFPIVDLADLELVRTSDVWGRFVDPIVVASRRYESEAIVIVRVSDHSLLPEQELVTKKTCQLCSKMQVVDWTLIGSSGQQFVRGNSYQNTEIMPLMTNVVSDIAHELYQRYAFNIGENKDYVIDVVNVDSLTQYAQLTDFLRSLSVVKTFQLLSAQGELRRFKLTLLGSEQSLLQALKLDESLKQIIDPLAPSREGEVPAFYWSK